jgi:choline monooxygenase
MTTIDVEQQPAVPESPRSLLPPEAYWSDDWFRLEQREVFARTWNAAGSSEEVAAPGDALVVDAGSDPLVVVRGDDGELRAFHNLCPHRGYKLVAASGPLGQSIRCDYHFWNFLLDGSLRHVPQMEGQFPGLDKSAWGLKPAAVAEWEGMVLVHPDPAASFDGWLGEFPRWLGSHRPGRYAEVLHTQFSAACNWKLFVENHVDVLHLWYLHARTLGEADHDRFEWWQSGPHWGSYEPMKASVAHRREGLTPLPDLDVADRLGVRANLLFPNLMTASGNEFFLYYQARPTSATTTTIDLRIRAVGGADPERALQTARPFLVEDIRAAERVQATVRSSAFAVGPLGTEHEAPIEQFHRWLLAALRATSGGSHAPSGPGPGGQP